MIKHVFAAILQLLLFLAVFAAFSFVPPFHLQHVAGATPEGTRVFIWDGLLLAAMLFALILGVEAARRRLRTSGLWTTIAFALAVILGLAAKLGFKTNPGW